MDIESGLSPVVHDIRGIYTYGLKADATYPAGTFRVEPRETKKAESSLLKSLVNKMLE